MKHNPLWLTSAGCACVSLGLAAHVLAQTVSSGKPASGGPGPKVIYVPTPTPTPAPTYSQVIQKVSGMNADPTANNIAQKYGLDVLDLTWEDTGRYQNSSVGPNISDMTIQVANREGKNVSVTCMPVMRFPNYSDKTGDISPNQFTLLVGNQAKRPLKRVSLYNFLKSPTAFMTRPWSWKGKQKSLLASRDSKVLVSAQACFLPIPQQGKATFNPVLFNYQSVKGDPAVLTILATREGTSMTIIDNVRDAFQTGAVWGQRLFHNANGQRASLTGTRQSEFLKSNPKTGTSAPAAAGQSGLNMVLLIQVPLKQKRRDLELNEAAMALPAASIPAAGSAARSSDVENAVIGHGELEGKFTETDFLAIERDPRFPVRVTVQFYKATSNGAVTEKDVRDIRQQIDRVYKQSSYIGSLVTGGRTGRVTEYEGVKVQPADWWQRFWKQREKETGKSRGQMQRDLMRLLGRDYQTQPVCELYLRDALAQKR